MWLKRKMAQWDWRSGQGPGTGEVGGHGKAFGFYYSLLLLYCIFIIPSEMGGKSLESFKQFGPIPILKSEAVLFYSFVYQVIDS